MWNGTLILDVYRTKNSTCIGLKSPKIEPVKPVTQVSTVGLRQKYSLRYWKAMNDHNVRRNQYWGIGYGQFIDIVV